MYKEILTVGLFAAWFAGESGIPAYIANTLFKFGIKKSIAPETYIPIRLYPIDCERCLGFWLGVIVFWEFTYPEIIIYSGVCSLIAIVSKLIISRLK